MLATAGAVWSRYRTVAPLLQLPGATHHNSSIAGRHTYLLDVCGKPLRDATGTRVCLVTPVKGVSLLVTEAGDAVQVTGESVASGVRALPGLELSLAGDVLVDGSGNKLLGEFGAVMRVSGGLILVEGVHVGLCSFLGVTRAEHPSAQLGSLMHCVIFILLTRVFCVEGFPP
jgi:hypothetical protein